MRQSLVNKTAKGFNSIDIAMKPLDSNTQLSAADKQTLRTYLLRKYGPSGIPDEAIKFLREQVTSPRSVIPFRTSNRGPATYAKVLVSRGDLPSRMARLPFSMEAFANANRKGMPVELRGVLAGKSMSFWNAAKRLTAATGRDYNDVLDEYNKSRPFDYGITGTPYRTRRTDDVYVRDITNLPGELLMKLAGNPNSIRDYPYADAAGRFLGQMLAAPVTTLQTVDEANRDPKRFLYETPSRVSSAVRSLNPLEKNLSESDKVLRTLNLISGVGGGVRLVGNLRRGIGYGRGRFSHANPSAYLEHEGPTYTMLNGSYESRGMDEIVPTAVLQRHYWPISDARMIRKFRKKNIEYLFFRDKKGRVWFATSNSPDAVRLSVKDYQKMKDLVIHHNHPLNGPPSGQDVLAAVKFDYSKLNVYGRDGYDYILDRPMNGWPKYDSVEGPIRSQMGKEFLRSLSSLKTSKPYQDRFAVSPESQHLDYSDWWELRDLLLRHGMSLHRKHSRK